MYLVRNNLHNDRVPSSPLASFSYVCMFWLCDRSLLVAFHTRGFRKIVEETIMESGLVYQKVCFVRNDKYTVLKYREETGEDELNSVLLLSYFLHFVIYEIYQHTPQHTHYCNSQHFLFHICNIGP